MFTYKDLASTSWYQWASEHKNVVNEADLGAKISGEAPSDKALARWIRALGIGLLSKRIEASQLIDIKEKKTNPAKTKGGSAYTPKVDHVNKTARQDKKSQGKRELIRVYVVIQKSMKRVNEVMGIKEQTKPGYQVEQPKLSALAPSSQLPVDVLPAYDEPPIEFYAQYVLDDLPALDEWGRPTELASTSKTPNEIRADEVFAEMKWMNEAKGWYLAGFDRDLVN
ncbi:MAG: hypothetical protein ABFS56_21440 [Pseudomonadota bacterium]